jgi:hypothetical protein
LEGADRVAGERWLTAEGIAAAVGKSLLTVRRWRRRYVAKGVDGLLKDATRPSRVKPCMARVQRVSANPSPAGAPQGEGGRPQADRVGASSVCEDMTPPGGTRLPGGLRVPDRYTFTFSSSTTLRTAGRCTMRSLCAV